MRLTDESGPGIRESYDTNCEDAFVVVSLK